MKIFLKKKIFNENFFTETTIINDNNFNEFLEKKEILNKNLFLDGFFQNKEFLQKYENEIKNLLNVTYRDVDTNSVFIHYRIGDIINDRRMLPVEYYEDALESINFNQGYISSDTINHNFCIHLIKKYNLKPIHMSPLSLIDFAKNFNNIILSEGTFSWWIGFLSQAETIICNKRNYFWHGDIFFDRWKKLSWDYKIESVYDNYKLNSYKPTKNLTW